MQADARAAEAHRMVLSLNDRVSSLQLSLEGKTKVIPCLWWLTVASHCCCDRDALNALASAYDCIGDPEDLPGYRIILIRDVTAGTECTDLCPSAVSSQQKCPYVLNKRDLC